MKHIHFIGIDGISMSAIATIMLRRGCTVSGSDLKHTALSHKLESEGAKIYLGHSAENVDGADLVVYTAAIKPDNCELLRAKQNGTTTLNRASFLGQLMSEARVGIAVAGSHGKTTTAAMIGLMLEYGGLDPTVLIGGELDALGGNVKIGGSEYFVAEACEYVETFLSLHPFIGVVLNIDADHLDYFTDLNHVKSAFQRFVELVPPGGSVVAGIDDPNVRSIIGQLNCHVITFGFSPQANIRAENVIFNADGSSAFDLYFHDTWQERLILRVPGRYNISNALAAIAVGRKLHIPLAVIKKTFEDFKGTHRRFEYKGTYSGAIIIDDYAHHPTEIVAALSATKILKKGRLIVVFQPHTYTRTKALLPDFALAFADADEVIITDIYAAREKNIYGITSADLTEAIAQHHQQVIYIPHLNDVATYLAAHLRAKDMLITMGAGDVHEIGERLVAMNCEQ
ncbi:MAG: UDP-N-acetylmuramate--L-alanine ligase [bacterium]|nr:UDP-N-acetylmuramate--L-alanine ligase [bacterium]